MADNIFEILIKYGLDKTKAMEAAAELGKLKTATTETGKEGVKQEAAVEEATKKTFTSKKQLKDMVKQLGHEFPILGQLGRLALNPIIGATAGVIAAFQIWKFRTDELTKSLGGVELPDFKRSRLEQMDAFAEKLAKIANNATSASTRLSQLQKDIDADAEFWKALGVDVGTGPAKAKAAAAEAEATRLFASGVAKQKLGVKPLSEADAKKLAESVDVAEKDIADRQQRLGRIDETQQMGRFNPARLFYDNQFRTRYGNNTTYDAARDIERGGIASSRGIIDFAANYKNRVAVQGAGDSEVAASQKIIEQNVGTRQGIRNETAAKFKAAAEAIDIASITELPAKMMEMFRLQKELFAAVEANNREIAARQKIQAQQQ